MFLTLQPARQSFIVMSPEDLFLYRSFDLLNPQMVGGQRTAQRRVMSSFPEDRSLQKSSTYIVPCFLFVEVSRVFRPCET